MFDSGEAPISLVRFSGTDDRLTAAAVLTAGAAAQQPWVETLRQAKDIGKVDIQACSLSMDLLGLSAEELDPVVDGIEGVRHVQQDVLAHGPARPGLT